MCQGAVEASAAARDHDEDDPPQGGPLPRVRSRARPGVSNRLYLATHTCNKCFESEIDQRRLEGVTSSYPEPEKYSGGIEGIRD